MGDSCPSIASKAVRYLAQVGIAVALLWALFFFGYVRVENLAGLKSQPGAVCLAALLAWLTIPVGAYRWHLLLKSQEIELPGSKVLWLTWFGIFANNYMPATLGTDFSRAVYLFRAFPDRKSAVLVSIVLDRLAALGGILSALALFSLDLLVTQDIPSWVLMLTFCAYGVLVLSALAWLYFRYRPAHHSVAVWLEARLGHTRFGKPFCQLVALLKNCKDSPGTIAKAFFLSLVNTLLMILAFYVLTQAAGFSVVSLLTVGFAAPLSLIVNMLPFSPGGLGIGEVGFAHIAMILMPHAQLEGTGVVFLAYRLVVLVTSLPGLLLLLGGRTLKAVPGSSARAEGAAK